MDTESSRRSFDRSREQGVKKPRLTEDGARNRNPNGYGLLQRSAAPETSSVASRLRATERVAAERDDPSRGGGYKPQHPHQELVTQYKMALSELTFNSKPIITNLTIIAGENQEAAKAIAATICSNIIEVPSDQKLPSLYLLDSIVKNIGRDYVKYFAARLPEVFCKAYRQVDSSIHTGMRHLFGTWKGVFPLQPLQIIEKELGFLPAVNGSSSVPATSRSDLQSQRPPHSIHVNPKYLEARQRLQQSNRAKEMTNELTATVADATEVVERLDRAAGIGAAKTWADLPVKMHNLQRPQSGGGPVHEKSIGTAYENYKYGPDFSKCSGLEVGRASERATELRHDKSRYAAGSDVAKAISNRGNGFAVKHKSPGYSTTSSVNADVHVGVTQSIADRNNGVLSTNWKNSEEEEYMWDDMNPRLKGQGAASSLKKYPCAPMNARNLDPRIPLRMNNVGSKLEMDDSINSLSTEQKEWALFGDKATSPWSIQEPQSIDGLSPSDSSTILSGPEDNPTSLSEFSTSARSSLVRTGLRPPVGPSPSGGSSLGLVGGASAGKLGQQWPNARGNASPSGQSPMHQHPPSPSYPGSQAAQIPGQLNVGLHNQLTEDSITIQSQNLQTSSPSFPSFQLRHQVPYSLQLQADPTQPEPSLLGQKLKLPQISNFRSQPTMGNSSPDHSNGLCGDFDGQSNQSSLLAAVMKSGILTNNSVTDGQRKIGCQNTRPLLQSAVQPPLPSGPPSGPKDASTTLLHSLDKASNSGNHSQRKVELPPLPLGLPQPSSTSESASAPISNEGGTTANPFSNLLSSLVAKGLISASKTESPGLLPPRKPMKSQNQSSSVVATGSMSVSSAPVSLATLISPIKNEVSLLEPDLKSSAALPESITVEVESLVGFEFKPDVIRQFHPSVVSGLVDDLPHRCSICGLRLRLKERLDRHLEWHASKKPETDSLCRASRKWYIHSSNWITRGLPSGFKSADMLDGFDEAIEKNEQMVPADESQCVCILCGELFEDFYSQERDEWMSKDAVYMTLTTGYNEMRAMKDGGGLGPIVHANCISKSSAHDFGLVNGVKLEEDR